MCSREAQKSGHSPQTPFSIRSLPYPLTTHLPQDPVLGSMPKTMKVWVVSSLYPQQVTGLKESLRSRRCAVCLEGPRCQSATGTLPGSGNQRPSSNTAVAMLSAHSMSVLAQRGHLRPAALPLPSLGNKSSLKPPLTCLFVFSEGLEVMG